MKNTYKNSALSRIFSKEIRLDLLLSSFLRLRKKFVKPMFFIFIVGVIYFWTLPRYYTANILLAPEYSSAGSSMSNSGLGSLASLAGLDLGNMSTEDAITPLSYPSVMQSTKFLVKLFDIKVQTLDGSFNGTYYDYLAHHQKLAPLDFVKGSMLNGLKKIKKIFSSRKEEKVSMKIDPFHLSINNYLMADFIKSTATCDVDKKTGVITISTVAQDPLVVAQLADSVKAQLQLFITDYRTKKSRSDLEYFTKLKVAAKKNYYLIQKHYSDYMDSHHNIILESVKRERDNLENEMSLAYDIFVQTSKQVQMAESKVQERTPAFSTIQNVTVPIKPAGPRRLIGLIVLLILGFIVATIYFLYKDEIPDSEVIPKS